MKWILLLLPLATFAASEKKVEIDLNKDGQVDITEYYEGKEHIRTEEDRNGDKKIDFITIHNDKKFYKIELQDTDNDGKFDRKESYKLESALKTIITTEVDKNADDVFDVNYKTSVNNDQRQDCEYKAVQSVIDQLNNATLDITGKEMQGYLPTGLGYKVDAECYKKWGAGFNEVIKAAVEEGLQCLIKLDKEDGTPTTVSAALRNAYKLSQLYKSDSVSLVCSETTYGWKDVAGHASSAKGMALGKVKQPFVSVNPDKVAAGPNGAWGGVLDMKNTIFHETLHNLGYTHGGTIEYPYACDTCCFAHVFTSKELKASACKICTGNYKNASDIEYVKEYVRFSRLNYAEDKSGNLVNKYIKEHGPSVAAISLAALANSETDNPVGAELAKIIEEAKLPLSDDDKKFLEEAKQNNHTEIAPVTIPLLAKALFLKKYKKNDAATFKLLWDNRAQIKKDIDTLSKSEFPSTCLRGLNMSLVLSDIYGDMFESKDINISLGASKLFEYFRSK